jgi:serine protease
VPSLFGELEAFLRRNDLLESTRAVAGVPPHKILGWEARAREHPHLEPLRSLLQYWRIDARGRLAAEELQGGHVATLVTQLRQIPGVESARVEYRGVPPTGSGVKRSDDPESYKQTYLGPPLDPLDPTLPGGINAVALWKSGADGSGVGLADVEYGWYTDHLDLVDQTFIAIPGEVDDGWKPHGTQVLGIIAAVDNEIGVVGIAPYLRDITLSSARKNGGDVPAEAIANVIDACQPGDVILLELQANDGGSLLPAEFDDDTFDAIRLACALDFVVVEAAANGKSGVGIDLDTVTDSGGVAILASGGRDSGAILVAASDSGPTYDAHPSSNYGSRVDCFAPGEDVVSCDDFFWYENESRSGYSDELGRTSAAAAIVAGAAVLLQSFWQTKTGQLLTPTEMRDRLSDPAINWPSSGSKLIGVMPDLGAIAGAGLPDIYIRDNTDDAGIVPSSGNLCQSPDIIVLAAPDADPQGSFGQGSGTEDDVDLSVSAVTRGSNHHLYARVRNRGTADAQNVTVDFYYSEPATLVTPDQWQPIGSTQPFDVPADDTLVVSNAVTWQSANIPAAGHYCFIAVANHTDDRAPSLAGSNWDGFIGLIANNNNVAWRNFNVVATSASSGQALILRFLVTGDPEHPREFTFQLRVPPRLCERIELAVPMPLAHLIAEGPGVGTYKAQGKRVHFDLTRTSGLRERRVILPAGARYPCELILTPPWSTSLRKRNELAVIQKHRGMMVGGITWLIADDTRSN